VHVGGLLDARPSALGPGDRAEERPVLEQAPADRAAPVGEAAHA
jgi:hypothetical protein